MSLETNLGEHRLALLEMLQESFRDPAKRSTMKTRGSSMQPLLHDHDEIVIRHLHDEPLAVGDVIAYRTGDTLLVHRVAAIVVRDGVITYYEKGDNNMYLSAVAPGQILGVVTEAVAGGRRLDLRARRFRLLGTWVARYGLRAVRLYDLARRRGRYLLRPGGRASSVARRLLYGSLQLPIRVPLECGRKWL